MTEFELEITVSGTVNPDYAADIVERVSLGQVNALYVTENGATSDTLQKDAAVEYLRNVFSEEPELVNEAEQRKSGLYYFEEEGDTELTSLPTPLNYEGPDRVELRNLAYTKSKQICYTLRTDFTDSEEEFVELRNSYSYDIPHIDTERQVNQFFELVGSIDMHLEE